MCTFLCCFLYIVWIGLCFNFVVGKIFNIRVLWVVISSWLIGVIIALVHVTNFDFLYFIFYG